MLSGEATAPSRSRRSPLETLAHGPGEVNVSFPASSTHTIKVLKDPVPSVNEPAATSVRLRRPVFWAFWPMKTVGTVAAAALKIRPTTALTREVGTRIRLLLSAAVTLIWVPDGTDAATS